MDEIQDWKHPDYTGIYRARCERLDKLRADPSVLGSIYEYYKGHPADFISDWGMTFDPRNPEAGLPAVVPLVLFDRQREFIDFVHSHWLGRSDCLAEKSRDMGVSWLCVAFAVWMWLFWDGVVVGFGSRKEEYVDKIGDPKSLFWKVRQFIDLLPPEFKPAGFDSRKHAPSMRIINPVNGSVIVGEAGDNIGRGNRTSIYFKDESAFYEHADAIDAALSQTSNCKIDVSTPNGVGNAFYRKRHGGNIDVFTFSWRQDPRKDQAWYDKQRRTLDPVVLAQEVDLDYNASVDDIFIPGALVSAAQSLTPAQSDPVGGWIIGIDAAHMGNDETVITMRRGRFVKPQVCRRQVDGNQIAAIVCDEIDGILSADGVMHSIVVELDGPGVSAFDAIKASRHGRLVVGVHTGARRSDGRNYNLKAAMCRKAKEALEQGGYCLPPDPELYAQICAIRQSYKDGLLIMQDKKQNKKLIGRSPDRADSWFLTYAGPDRPMGDQSPAPDARQRANQTHALAWMAQ